MTTALTVAELFTDAREIHRQALERLEAGDIQDAAEKAWCATKRATDALVLSRTNEVPQRTNQTSAGIRRLGQEGERLASLRGRFSDIVHYLHSDCSTTVNVSHGSSSRNWFAGPADTLTMRSS